MNNIKLMMSKNIKNYWTTLQTNAEKYEQTIFYAMRKALQRNGISTDEWTNEEVVKYFLPASFIKIIFSSSFFLPFPFRPINDINQTNIIARMTIIATLINKFNQFILFSSSSE